MIHTGQVRWRRSLLRNGLHGNFENKHRRRSATANIKAGSGSGVLYIALLKISKLSECCVHQHFLSKKHENAALSEETKGEVQLQGDHSRAESHYEDKQARNTSLPQKATAQRRCNYATTEERVTIATRRRGR
eukprot:359790-Pleurochrysis_carterae.AAC.1